MDESSTTHRVCSECRRENRSDAEVCWLCGAILAGNPYAPPTAGAPEAEQPYSFSLGTLLVVVTLASVVCGLFAIAPGLGILGVLLCSPALVRTALVMRKREAAGLDVSPTRKLLFFVGSFFTSAIVMAVVTIASVGTFCGVCLGLYQVNPRASESELIIACIAGLVAGGVVLALLARWIRSRWRRDIHRP